MVKNRAPFDEKTARAAARIVSDVRKNGDVALLKYAEKFDGCAPRSKKFRVTKNEIDAAEKKIDPSLRAALIAAKKNILAYHKNAIEKSWSIKEDGVSVGQKIAPLHRVGIYVPAGSAPLVSTVLMTALPAVAAGVSEIAMVTPPEKFTGKNASGKNAPKGKIADEILAAAKLCGITEIYKIGGAHAIAALAYGTGTIRRVDKIFGPGNAYVQAAKKAVFGDVGIDMIAGPSEIVIVADGSARADFVAADMLSQAEHDPLSMAVLITDSKALSIAVRAGLVQQLKTLSRKATAGKSLRDFGNVIVTKNIDDAIERANDLAPEHLELMVKNPKAALPKIKNAGAIFLGPFSPEPLGDYFAGPNHTLPTGGTARFASVLNTSDFMKKSSVISYDKPALKKASKHIAAIAAAEGLDAHGNAVRIRFV
jgi:histidinol dehydrogenase